jgi:putative lipoprotein
LGSVLAFATACTGGASGEAEVESATPDRAEAGEKASPGASQASPAASQVRTYAYLCGETPVLAYFGPTDSLDLVLPARELRLAHVRSGSGAKYDGHGVSFWSKGREAVLEVEGTALTCTVDRRLSILEDARRRGIVYWATGNEPGWTLEIGPTRIVWRTDYGQTEHDFALAEPRTDEASSALLYETESGGRTFTAQIRAMSCADDMSGERFESEVRLTFDGRDYRGCGQRLR